jgi:hypothetical protein
MGPSVSDDMFSEGQASLPTGNMKRVLFFAIGVALGALLFLVGGVSLQPTPPKCPGCAVLSPRIHNPECTEAVQGGRICEGP